MSEFLFPCPSCQSSITCDEQLRGTKIKCPVCQNDLLVPPASGKGRLAVAVHTPPTPGAAAGVSPFPEVPQKKKRSGPLLNKTVVNCIVLVVFAGVMVFLGKKFNWLEKGKEYYAKIRGEEAVPEPATNAAPEVAAPPVVEVPVVWTTNLSEVQIPAVGQVKGMFGGTNFTVDAAQLNNNILTLRQGTNASSDKLLQIHFAVRPGESLAGKTFTVSPATKSGAPKVAKQWVHNPKYAPTTKWFQIGYTMQLEFGQLNAEGALPGKIYLALPDTELSYVAGNFVASVNSATAQAQSSYTPPAPTAQRATGDERMRARYGIQ